MAPSPRRWRRLLTAATLAAGSSVVAAVVHAPAAAAIPLPATDYQHVQLALGSAELGEPMSLAVLPDRRVLHTARDGTVRVTDAAGNTKVAGKLYVYSHDEEGLQGVAVDPGFATNQLGLPVLRAARCRPRTATRRPTAPPRDFAPWKGH